MTLRSQLLEGASWFVRDIPHHLDELRLVISHEADIVDYGTVHEPVLGTVHHSNIDRSIDLVQSRRSVHFRH